MTTNTITLPYYPNGNGLTLAAGSLEPRTDFHVEAVPGGFIVSGVGGRQVARNVAQVARLLREWAAKPEAKPAGAAE